MQTDERSAAAAEDTLAAEMRRRLVRFNDVKADWSVFTPVKVPGNDRAVFQYVASYGPGTVDSWALPAEHFGVYLLYVPPAGGCPYHSHAHEEVFRVLEGRMSFS